MRVKARRSWIAPIVLTTVTATAVQTWFRPRSIIAAGDNFPTPLVGAVDALGNARAAWQTSVTPTGGLEYMGRLEVIPALVGRVLEFAGIGASGAQRVVLTACFVAMALGMLAFLRLILPGPGRDVPAAVGALFYAFNASLLFTIPGLVYLTGLALLPVFLVLVLRGARSRAWRYPVALAVASLPLSYVFENPSLCAVVVAPPLLTAAVLTIRAGGVARLFVARGLALVLVINLWWTVPVALALTGSATVTPDADVFAWAWTHARSSIPNVLRLLPFWAWPDPASFPYAWRLERAPAVALQFVPAAITLLAPFVTRGRLRRLAIGAAAIAAVLVVLDKGLHPPLSGLNEALYRSIPGMWLLREPTTKLTPILAGTFAVGMACFIAAFRRRAARYTVAGALGIGTIVLAFPIWTGIVIPGERLEFPSARVTVPAYWTEAAAFLNDRPGRVLLLPSNDFYQMPYDWYYGTDVVADALISSPVVKDPRASTYFDVDASARDVLVALRQAIDHRDWTEAVHLLRALDVRWVLVRHDIDSRFRGRSLQDPRRLSATLRASSGFRFAKRAGSLEIFELESEPARVWTASYALTTLPGTRIGRLLSLPSGTRSAVIADPSAALPIPARKLVTANRSEWRRQAGSQVLRMSGFRGAYTAYTSWPEGAAATVEITTRGRGQSVTVRPPELTVAGGSLRAAFRTTRFALGRTRARRLLRIGPTFVPLPPAVPSVRRLRAVLAPGTNDIASYLPSGKNLLVDGSFERGTWSSLLDCQSRGPGEGDPRLRVRQVREAVGGHAVELSARFHSACIRQRVPVLGNERVFRVSVRYAHRAGTQPRICVWQTVVDHCVPLPPLPRVTGWGTYSAFFRPAPGTSALDVFLYADGDGRRTVSRYDDVVLEEYLRVGLRRGTLSISRSWAAAGDVTSPRDAIDARLDDHRSPASGSLLDDPSFEHGLWSGLSDCRSGSSSGSSADLVARRVGTAVHGRSALVLSARANSACVHQVAARFSAEASYRLTVGYRRVSGSPPRICVWQTGAERCVPLPELEADRRWHVFRTIFKPDPNATGLDLYLYADGRPDGTRIVYDDVRLELVARPDVALVARGVTGSRSTPRVHVTSRNAFEYRVSVRGATGPFLLVLGETFHPGWELRGAESRHLRAHGYANGWIIERTGDFAVTLQYRPQRWFDAAAVVSLAAVPAMLILLFGGALARRGVAPFRRARSSAALSRAAAYSRERGLRGSAALRASADRLAAVLARVDARASTRYLAAGGFYLLAGVLWFAPLVAHPEASVFGPGPSDGTSLMRELWAMDQQDATPFTWERDRLRGAPEGIPRVPSFAVHNALHQLILWQGGKVAGWVLAMNLYLMASFVLAGFFMFLLLYYLRVGYLPALFGGYVFAFLPEHFWMAYVGHAGRAQNWVLPLVLLALFRARKTRTLVATALAGSTLSLAVYFDGYLGLFALFVFCVFVAVDVIAAGERRIRLLLRWATALPIAVCLLVPPILAWQANRDQLQRALTRDIGDIEEFSARMTAYLLPAEYHPVLGALTRSVYARNPAARNFDEATLFVGYTTLALAGYALLSFWRSRGRSSSRRAFVVPFAAALAAVGFVMSRANVVDIGGVEIPSPAYLIGNVTLAYRAFARFGVLVALGLIVLAALGLSRIRRRHGPWPAVGLFVVCALELAAGPPIATWRIDRPTPDVPWLAARPGGLVANYPLYESYGLPDGTPLTDARGKAVFYQQQHRHALFDGTLLGSPASEVRMLANDLTSASTPALLARYGVRYVVLHDALYRSLGEPEPRLAMGFREVATFDDTRVWAVTAAPRDADVRAIAIRGSTGFLFPDRERRWMEERGAVVVQAWERDQCAQLSFEAASLGGARRLELRKANGSVVAATTVGAEARRIDLAPVRLRRGREVFWLVASGSRSAISQLDSRTATIWVTPFRLSSCLPGRGAVATR